MSEIPQEILDLSFEQAYARLEETVQNLERGNLSLQDSLAMYQRGMTLAQHCSKMLDQAELSVKALAPSGDLLEFDEL